MDDAVVLACDSSSICTLYSYSLNLSCKIQIFIKTFGIHLTSQSPLLKLSSAPSFFSCPYDSNKEYLDCPQASVSTRFLHAVLLLATNHLRMVPRRRSVASFAVTLVRSLRLRWEPLYHLLFIRLATHDRRKRHTMSHLAVIAEFTDSDC